MGVYLYLRRIFNLTSYSQNHIDILTIVPNQSQKLHFIGVYGEPNSQNHTKFWSLIRRLKKPSNEPWICLGDFNQILSPSERQGGANINTTLVLNFRKTLRDTELYDLGFK